MYPTVDFFVVIAVFEIHLPHFHRRAEIIGFTDTRERAIAVAKEKFPVGAAYVCFKHGSCGTQSTVVEQVWRENALR